LFDEGPREDASPSRHLEGEYAFWNRHASTAAEQVRGVLDAWFLALPDDAQRDLLPALTSDDDGQFQAAFWELYLHEAFRREGFDIEIHPEVPGSARRPDFKVRAGAQDAYVEATASTGPSEENRSDRLRAALYDGLEDLERGDFWLAIGPDFEEGPTAPSARRIREQLKPWLASLNWEVLRPLFEEEGFTAMPSLRVEDNGWDITFDALPKPPDQRGRGRTMAVFAGRVTVSDPIESIRRQLKGKARRYGDLPAPYVIAFLDRNNDVRELDDVTGALFGRTVQVFGRGSDGMPVPGEVYRKRDGFWKGPPDPRNTRVAAVITVPNLRPHNVAELQPLVWQNPWAIQPLEVSLPWPSLRHNATTDEISVTSAPKAPHEVMGLPPGGAGHTRDVRARPILGPGPSTRLGHGRQTAADTGRGGLQPPR
jgi:hypothetical protein